MPTTSNFGWTTPADTDLVKDGAAAIRTLGNGIDTSFLDLKGGTSGQVLSKNSNTDLDYTWVTPNVGDITEVQAGTGISVASGTGPIPVITNTATTTIDAEGDLLVGDAADALQRLAIGSNGNVLTVDTSVDGKIKWAAPAGGGKVLQVVYAEYSTLTTTTLTSFANTGLSATITPSSASSKVLVIFTHNGVQKSSGNGANSVQIRLQRTTTDILKVSDIIGHNGTSSDNPNSSNGAQYLDSPNTTSATTYRTQFASGVSGQTAVINNHLLAAGNTNSTMVLMEIGA
jgi:hypothetical protein